jgi:hypothetical protein
MNMKTYTTILILAAALFAHSAARAADNSLELVLSDDHVVFTTATNISMEMIFRNVGETNMDSYALLADTLIVLDGKEFKRAPFAYEGRAYLRPKGSWQERFVFSEFRIPLEALTSGRHTVMLRNGSSESNTETIFIEPQK